MTEPLITFVHLTDTHLPSRKTGITDGKPSAHANARAVIAQINALPFPVELVLHTGDVGHDPAVETDYLAARETLAPLKPPLHIIPGNHDRAKWMYHVVTGRVPDSYYYSFEANGVQFICLDSTIPHTVHGEIDEQQLAWLNSQLSVPSDMPLVVAVHHHPFPLGSTLMDSYILTNGDALHKTLLKAQHRVRCVLFGHIHETVSFVRDGITYASTQSTWYQLRTWQGQDKYVSDNVQTPGFNVVDIMPDATTIIRAFRASVNQT